MGNTKYKAWVNSVIPTLNLREIIETNKDGFTLDLNGNMPKFKGFKGYCVSLTNNFNSDINLLIENFNKIPLKEHSFIGGWNDGKTFYLDNTFILFQGLVKSGLVWNLQGSYGRLAHDLIKMGVINVK